MACFYLASDMLNPGGRSNDPRREQEESCDVWVLLLGSTDRTRNEIEFSKLED